MREIEKKIIGDYYSTWDYQNNNNKKKKQWQIDSSIELKMKELKPLKILDRRSIDIEASYTLKSPSLTVKISHDNANVSHKIPCVKTMVRETHTFFETNIPYHSKRIGDA